MSDNVTRTRTQSSVNEYYHDGALVRCNGTIAETYNAYAMGLFSGSSKTTTDVVVPGFHARKERGEIFNNPFDSTLVEHEASYEGWRIDRIGTCTGTTTKAQYNVGNRGTLTEGHFISAPAEWNEEPANAAYLAGTAAMAGVASADVMGMVELAELRKTIRLIRNPMRELESLLRKALRDRDLLIRKRLRRNSRRKLSPKAKAWLDRQTKNIRLSDYIAGEWLKYRYGVMPLVYSIEDAYKVAVAPLVSERRTSRGYSMSAEKSTETDVAVSDVYFNCRRKLQVKERVSVRAGVLYEHHITMAHRTGFAWSEVPATAIELIPFSFVVDWFVNLSDVVRAITPKAGVRYLAKWTTIRKETDQIGVIYNSAPKTISNYTVSGTLDSTAMRWTTRVVRTPGLRVGLASQLENFSLDVESDKNHVLDGIAIIRKLLAS